MNDEMEDTIYCPKCAQLSVKDEELHLFVGECLECGFIFCTNCNKEFHGYEDCHDKEKLKTYTNTEADLGNSINPHLQHQLPSTLECQICFTETTLDDTADLGCEHLYCKTCVKGYYETLVKDGRVNNLKCPFQTCYTKVRPFVLKNLIDPEPEVYTILDSKLLDEALQDTPDIVCCPKLGCGRRFKSMPEYGNYESCNYRFCTNCLQAYHGLTVCGETEEQTLEKIKQFIKGDNEDEKERLEEERAKRKVQDEQSYGFINKLCKKCPHCRANIKKSEGCNHRICTKCSTHFCWKCRSKLDERNHYRHYQFYRTGCALFSVPSESRMG